MSETQGNLISGGGDGGGRVEPADLQTVMQQSYIDYAMTVIVGTMALRNACRVMTARSASPFARAVRT